MKINTPLIFTLIFVLVIATRLHASTKKNRLQSQKDVTTGVFKIEIDLNKISQKKAHGFDYGKIVKIRKLFFEQRYGTGFLYEHNDKIYLITCAHVVEAASEQYGSIVARDVYEKTYNMKLVGGDTFYDLAILEFQDELPPASFFSFKARNRKVSKAEDVKCIGFAFAEKGMDRLKVEKVSVSAFENDFMTDAGGYGYFEVLRAMKPGMSGGPVIDLQNNWVGMIARTKIYQNNPDGYTLAQDASVLDRAIQRIFKSKNGNRIERCFLGVGFHQKVQKNGNTSIHPVTIGSVVAFSKAEKYLGNDYIGFEVTQINNIPIKNIKDIYRALEAVHPKSVVKLHLKKGKIATSVNIKTDRLNDFSLSGIGKDYFKQNPNYELLTDDDEFTLKDLFYGTHHPFEVAGIDRVSNKVLYLANTNARLGVIVRLFSTIGTFCVYDTDNHKIAIHNSPKENISQYTLRVLYY